jgi:FKBP-type peptidyl-prolyl cis-trans isomerase FkpA
LLPPFAEVYLKRLVLSLALISLVAFGGDGMPTGATKLEIVDTTVGTGATAVAGDTVTVNYVGTLTNGTKFDSSYDRGQPYTFKLGANQVIAGFDQGVTGMRVGGKRKVTIPPSLGYGINPNGPIPGNSTLIFDIELMSIAGK